MAIFNGTTTAGLASRVGGTVSTAGWTLGQLGNWGGAPQQRSVIFYSGAAQKGNAEALGELLGIADRGGLGRIPACRWSWCWRPASSSRSGYA